VDDERKKDPRQILTRVDPHGEDLGEGATEGNNNVNNF
jgi:hypothetical protein